MKHPKIDKIAVLGAGVMGAQIAAHCINAGFETILFDLPSKEGDRYALLHKAVQHLQQLKPAPWATLKHNTLLQLGNYEDDLAELSQCTLIIEAIAERLDWKQALYQRISPFLHQDSIVVSNTSGLSIESLAESLPKSHWPQFCGMHFFNPPRYMHLVELIPSKHTEKSLLDTLETWLVRWLGKGVVRAKDTPNFIANRIGVFSLLATIHHADTFGISLDEVDALTGVLIGRPKSATFRTMDVVGLDTMAHVVSTMQQQLNNDPWQSVFVLPDWLVALIEEGHLGQKTGQGIYRKHGNSIEIYDRTQREYRAINAVIYPPLLEILQLRDAKEHMQKLQALEHPQAQFLAACFRDLFHYTAYHLSTIAKSVRDVDLALRWGFGWQQGPFELWQEADVVGMSLALQQAIKHGHTLSSAPLPQWLHGCTEFYTAGKAFSPEYQDFIPPDELPVYQRQFFPSRVLYGDKHRKNIVYEQEGVSLWSLKEGIVVAQFKSVLNTIGRAVLDGMQEVLLRVEQDFEGLIIYQDNAEYFSAGADLKSVLALIQNKQWQTLEAMVADFQALLMRMKYSSVPVVAALRGRALGGGCEWLLHCAGIVAAFESYPGLVELGVGVIPAGGGCKEMAIRAAEEAGSYALIDFIRPYFEQIAKGQVAGSALEAQGFHYLSQDDAILMHSDEVLYAALSKVQTLCATNYRPLLPGTFPIAGVEGYATLRAGLQNWLEGGFITEYDYVLGERLAFVLCGGDIPAGTLVDEAWMLHLERQAFMTLAQNMKTEARIEHMLKNGKVLRN